MSEVKLNLIDSQTILSGTIHGSVVESCIAALSAEPETIAELATALSRYIKPLDDTNPFGWFRPRSDIDERPYDAGIVIIDLAARIVAAESSYTQPAPDGEVRYHDGKQGTDVGIPYRLPSDWLLVNSIDAHRWSRERRVQERHTLFDAREVLYGRPLLEFIIESVTPELRSLYRSLRAELLGSPSSNPISSSAETAVTENSAADNLAIELPASEIALNGSESKDTDATREALNAELTRIHASWLTTPRSDLQDRAPRDVMLEKQDFIDFDLHTRALQWTFLNEGPPCLARDSFAYRFAGFGTHEWVVYYDLVRDLLKAGVALSCPDSPSFVCKLEEFKTEWLESANDEYDGRTPAVIIDNERKRLPEAMAPEQLIIDEDCECCRMMAQDAAMGYGPGFWHLDGSHMEEEFAFSCCKTMPEWEVELKRREESYLEFERQWAEREASRREMQREWDEEQIRLECAAEEEEEVTIDLPLAKRSG